MLKIFLSFYELSFLLIFFNILFMVKKSFVQEGFYQDFFELTLVQTETELKYYNSSMIFLFSLRRYNFQFPSGVFSDLWRNFETLQINFLIQKKWVLVYFYQLILIYSFKKR